MDYSMNQNQYSKRSIWKWIGIYVVIAAVLYTGIFLVYREVKDRGADDTGATTTQSTSLY
jgi:flagellar biosynthesis/type III secretory pathway M-ring protein FliF/YscJ